MNVSIREFLITRRGHILDRPHMYGPDPKGLEAILQFIDEILEIDSDDYKNGSRSYSTYLMKKGYGSADYCYRKKYDNPEITDAELWDGLVEFWKEYLREKEQQS